MNENAKKESQERVDYKKILAALSNHIYTLFKDQHNEAYIELILKSKKYILSLKGGGFQSILINICRTELDAVPNRDVLSRAIDHLTSKAIFEGEQKELSNRVGVLDGEFWYDMKEGKAIRCTPKGWHQNELPTLFYDYRPQKAQITPQKMGGDVKLFLEFTTLKGKEEQCLFLVWLVSCFIPNIPHPILLLYGEKGAAKTTIMKLAKEIIDPSLIGLLSFPNRNELVQQLSHHYVVCYDNVRRILPEDADLLCRAVTGLAASKRKLYSDDDDFLYNFRNCIAINGINVVAQTPDLLDRSILVEVQRIEPEERREESEINQEFEKNRSAILGGIFDAVCLAMKIYPNLSIGYLPRMADFAKWAYAISEALGYGGGFFMKAYEENAKKQNEEALEAEPVAVAIVKLLEYKKEWEGTPTDLYVALTELIENLGIDRRVWIKTPNVLGRKLREVKSNLKVKGILFDEFKGEERTYLLRKIDGNAAAVDFSSRDSKVDKADKVGIQNGLAFDEKIKDIFGENTEITNVSLNPDKDE